MHTIHEGFTLFKADQYRNKRMSNHGFLFDERLDREFLDSMFEGDREHAEMVFAQFLELAPSQMQDIESRFLEGVMEDFRQKVHKIKPVFSFVGLTQLTGMAEQLENKCREACSMQEIGPLYQEFKTSYRVFLPVIEQEYSRLKA